MNLKNKSEGMYNYQGDKILKMCKFRKKWDFIPKLSDNNIDYIWKW